MIDLDLLIQAGRKATDGDINWTKRWITQATIVLVALANHTGSMQEAWERDRKGNAEKMQNSLNLAQQASERLTPDEVEFLLSTIEYVRAKGGGFVVNPDPIIAKLNRMAKP